MKGVCVGLFTIVVCGPFLLIGLLIAWKTSSLRLWGVRTEATVVDTESDGEGSYPIVEFVDRAGATHRVKLSVSGEEQPGNTMTVLYNADYPLDAIGTSFGRSWLFHSVCIFLGGGGVWIGFRILFGGIPGE